MKPLLVLAKIFFIGCLWSIFFVEGIRVIMLINWHFDIFWPPHWAFAWETWHSGWVIRHAKEWAFVIILLTAIPMWLTGWIFLSVVDWLALFKFVFIKPLLKIKSFINDLNAPIRNDIAVKKVVKKKSYKEIRPNIHHIPLGNAAQKTSDSVSKPAAAPVPVSSATLSAKEIKPSVFSAEDEKKPFTHSVFEFDDDDDDFDLDFDYAVRSIKKQQNAINEEDKEPSDNSFSDNSDNDYDDDEPSRDEEYSDRRKSNRRRDDYERQPRNNRREDRQDRDSGRNRNDRSQKNERNDRNSRQNRDISADDDAHYEDSGLSFENSRTEKRNNQKQNQRQEGSKNNRTKNSEPVNPTLETIRQKGYEVISGVTIKDTFVDYIAVSDNTICICLIDKEPGDWLADEERFNDEEPLWFSENSHRISPVRLVDITRNHLADKLDECNIAFEIKAYVVVQTGNIINAEDMFDTWDNLNVKVTRINRGMPKELPLFSRTIEEVDEKIDGLRFESLKKLIRNI